MNVKQRVLRLIFFVQILACVGLYFFGANGIKAIFTMKAKNVSIEQEVRLAYENINKLEAELNLWHEDLFYVEQHAREQLAMARDGDEIYILE